ncbi:histidine phosphatase family protein [Paenibacillus lycopersici]|uniref:Histidine phosphatase family protein n=1 Tax=Paenibacillus lycopersici TaxID=2704462 RepID=A0A6C0FYD4_9BACL|nr:histidine phosphatase family protein [Paenibacillus lycopersici]QHT59220.1 histidine phosphatase family protein [Paenibacillus lycopersici]
MKTSVLLVRHAESSVHLGADRTRGLTDRGREDVLRLTAAFGGTNIDAVVSSPYLRAVLTVQGIADGRGLPVRLIEELRERELHGGDAILPRAAFLEAVANSFADPDAALPGGESFRAAQSRGVLAVQDIVRRYRGKTIVAGTHGSLMTMILRAYEERFDYAFWERLTMPDAYRMTFDGDKLIAVEREWNE